MPPHRLAGVDAIGDDHLFVAALLLREQQVALDRERRPARPDRPLPHLHRRVGRPVGFDPHAANDAVARRSAESGPFDPRHEPRRAVGPPWQLAGVASRTRLALAAVSPSVGGRRRRSGGGQLAAGGIRRTLVGGRRSDGTGGRRPVRAVAPRRLGPAPGQSALPLAGDPVGPQTASRTAHARKIVAIIVARRRPREAARAHATSPAPARRSAWGRRRRSIMPMKPFEIDGWTSGEVAITAVAMTKSAPMRSDQGARLKNSHQMRIRAAPTTRPVLRQAARGMKNGMHVSHQHDQRDDDAGSSQKRLSTRGARCSPTWFMVFPY